MTARHALARRHGVAAARSLDAIPAAGGGTPSPDQLLLPSMNEYLVQPCIAFTDDRPFTTCHRVGVEPLEAA